MPGVGADGSTFLAYATVRNQSRDPKPEEFGAGVPEGVIAPESSNNATTGGTMIPMLTLGIPGDGSTAVMLGAMILHGLEPGVLLMQNNAPLVYGILASILVATLLMFLIGWTASSAFIRVLRRDRSVLFPFIMVFASIGAFAAENGSFPIYVRRAVRSGRVPAGTAGDLGRDHRAGRGAWADHRVQHPPRPRLFQRGVVDLRGHVAAHAFVPGHRPAGAQRNPPGHAPPQRPRTADPKGRTTS